MLSHNQIKNLKALKHRKYRIANDQFLIDGIKAVTEALTVSGLVQMVLISKESDKEFFLPRNSKIPVLSVPERILHSISSLKSPGPVIAVGKLSVLYRHGTFQDQPISGRFLLLDEIQDPGNTGTLFRMAEWFGYSGIFLTDGCAEPDNSKVIRASMGSVFRLPFYRISDIVKFIDDISQTSTLLIAADLAGTPLPEIGTIPESWILMMGNEGKGLRPLLKKAAYKTLTIPGESSTESLNVASAAAIISYHLNHISGKII